MSMAEKQSPKDLKGLESRETIARLFGVSGRRLDQLVQDGILTRTLVGRSSRFDTEETIQKYIKYLSDKAYGREKNNRETELKEQKLRAEVALKESQGELHRLRTEIAQGNYISIEEIKADYSRFFIVFKNFALAIPGKVAGRVSGLVEPVEARELESDLQKEVKRMLSDFVTKATVDKPKVEDVTKPKRKGRPPKNAKK